jgi:hypothetical protein
MVYFFSGPFRDSAFKELWVIVFVCSLFLPAWVVEKFGNPWKAWFSPRINAPLVPAVPMIESKREY